MRVLLRTGVGARLMRPGLGVGVDRYVFEPRTTDVCYRLAHDIERALLLWEPRVIVDAQPRSHQPGADAGAQQHPHGLLHVLDALGDRQDGGIGAVGELPPRREGPAAPQLGVVGDHAITTVGQPTGTLAPHPQESLARRAGRPLIITVPDPATNGEEGMCDGGGMGQACMSPRTAAGIPPIRTVDTPGPTTVPPWTVGSPTRAAAGMTPPSVDVDEGALEPEGPGRLE